MRLPHILSKPEVCALFGFTRFPFSDAELRPVLPETRPRGKPTTYFSAPAVYSKFGQLYGRLPDPSEIMDALAAVQRRRAIMLRSHHKIKNKNLGEQANA